MAVRYLWITLFVVGIVQGQSSVASSSFSAASPLVTITDYGVLRGSPSKYLPDQVYSFKGIPYGGSPAGDERWHHPPHPTPWTEIRNATTFGLPCPQLGVSNYTEDCLNLNVWVPINATFNDVTNNTDGVGVVPTSTNSKYPVYVWFHGGRFSSGAASDPRFDGSGLASKGVIVITMDYRLGALGFLAHPELSANSTSGTSGNYGLVDQQAILHWTNEQIANFGGDPTKITIGGSNAGAASVLNHINSGLASGLFEQVIAESGAIYPSNPLIGSAAEGYRNLSTAEAQGKAFLASLNLSSIAEARAAPVSLLLTGSTEVDVTYEGKVFQNNTIFKEPPLFRPVLDGYVLPATYQDLLESGDHNIVPILTGSNKDEYGASPNPGFSPATYNTTNSPIFSSVDMALEFFNYYPAGPNSTTADDSSNAFYRDQSRVSTWLWANEYMAGSLKNTSGDGTYSAYTYFWTHAPPSQDQGAGYMSEVQYAFNNLYSSHVAWTASDYDIADTMSDYWVNFISSGDPNGANLTTWPLNSKDSPVTMEVGGAWGAMEVASEDKIGFMREWFSKWPAY